LLLLESYQLLTKLIVFLTIITPKKLNVVESYHLYHKQ
jgi:hypothetical protein